MKTDLHYTIITLQIINKTLELPKMVQIKHQNPQPLPDQNTHLNIGYHYYIKPQTFFVIKYIFQKK